MDRHPLRSVTATSDTQPKLLLQFTEILSEASRIAKLNLQAIGYVDGKSSDVVLSPLKQRGTFVPNACII